MQGCQAHLQARYSCLWAGLGLTLCEVPAVLDPPMYHRQYTPCASFVCPEHSEPWGQHALHAVLY